MDNKETIQFNKFIYDTEWNISGAFSFFEYIVYFIEKVRHFTGGSPVKSVHDCIHNGLWNSGRVRQSHRFNKPYIDQIFRVYHELNIPLYLTFSNHKITEKDINDVDCNYLLDNLNKYNNGENGVIVSSDILSEYIKCKYPDLKQKASIIKTICEDGIKNLKYYKSLEQKFDGYVVALEDNFNTELLLELDKTKAEILVNERCVYNCPNRKEHYNLIADMHYNDNMIFVEKVIDFLNVKCFANPMMKQINKFKNCQLSFEELQNIYSIGFRKFKLQGRLSGTIMNLLHDLSYYLFDSKSSLKIFHTFSELFMDDQLIKNYFKSGRSIKDISKQI